MMYIFAHIHPTKTDTWLLLHLTVSRFRVQTLMRGVISTLR